MPWPPLDNSYARWGQGPANWLDICLATVGWGFGDKPAGRRQAYLDLLFPFDTPSAAKQYGAKMSSCALAALAWMRCWGLDDPELRKPYRIGRAVADVVTIARRHGAWEDGAMNLVDPTPELGDIVLIGGPGYGGTEHVFCCLGIEGGICSSIDGGQTDAGGQTIASLKRVEMWHNGKLWLGTRRVRGVARINLMAPTREQVRPVSL